MEELESIEVNLHEDPFPHAIVDNFYNEEEGTFEIGVDEVGRGPMFGRVYTAAVVLPKDGIDYSLFKDSKK